MGRGKGGQALKIIILRRDRCGRRGFGDIAREARRVALVATVLGVTVAAGPGHAGELSSTPDLRATSGGGVWQIAKTHTSSTNDVAYARSVIKKILQRTKTRQVSGGENLNVMEWTTQNGPEATMDGAVVYFKLFKSAFGFFNKRFNRFMRELPEEWDDFGKYQDAAKKFSNGDIKVANRMIIDIFEWFKPKQKMIGNQGGILILYAKDDGGGSMVAYADPNSYKSNNVAGILTGRSKIKKVVLSDDVLSLLPGADEFIQVILEDQEGLVSIEVPYILYEVPKR